MTTARARLREQARRWGVVVDTVHETHSSLIAYGRRSTTGVVLKVVKREGDEWHSGEVVEAFGGRAIARVYEHTAGALLLDRLTPGQALVEISRGGDDERATEIAASVIAAMTPNAPPARCSSVGEWGVGFDRYLEANDARVPRSLVIRAREVFANLCGSQRESRLLHGDLHHYNILFDVDRGWMAIDPKGVVGEREYELGAFLRNPMEDPSLFGNPRVIERRLEQFTAALSMDGTRVLRWAFAQAVLSAIWDWEDGVPGDRPPPVLLLADSICAMLGWN